MVKETEKILEEHLSLRAIAKRVRALARKKKLKLTNLAFMNAFPRDRYWREVWAAMSAVITQELINEKRWRAESKDVAFSEAFPEPQVEEKFSRMPVDRFFKMGVIDTYFPGEKDMAKGDRFELGSLPLYPKRAEPTLNNFMRRAPWDLKESILRGLVEGGFFERIPELLPAAAFFSAGIRDKEVFRHVWNEVYKNSPFHKRGQEFSFLEYERDLLRLAHLVKKQKQVYFQGNPWLKRTPEIATLWERFEAALGSLTEKQRNAMLAVYVDNEPQTKAARRTQISLDSLRNRLEAAKKKFRRALPELVEFLPSTTYRAAKERDRLYDGFYWKSSAKKVHPLYRVDPKTGKKTEIAPYPGGPRKKPNVDHARIRAWAITSSYVSEFADFTHMLDFPEYGD